MISNEIKSSLKKAISELNIAEDELSRSKEDVVTLSVCLTARHSMNDLMRVLLLNNSINPDEGESLRDLLNQCMAVNKQFNSINIGNTFCNELTPHECEDKYCLSNQNVNDCVSTAKQIKTLVLNTLQLTESELD